MIQDYEPWVILAWLSRSEHDTLLKSVAPYAIRQVYFLLFYAALVKLAHWHHPLGIKLPVNFVFAQQGTMGDQAAMWFSYVRRLKKPGIRELLGSSPVFEDDKLVAPRQAADMVAWHMRRRKDHPSKLDSNWPTATLSELLRAESHLQKEALQSAAEQMKKVPGFALVQGKPSKEFKTRLEEVVRNLKLSYLRQRLHEVLRAMAYVYHRRNCNGSERD